MSSHFRSYIDSVLKHVRSKDAHYGIQAELEAHINGLARTYRLRGYTEQEAVEKAVFEMGNPERAGKSLNNIHRPRTDWFLIGILLMLLGIGLVTAYNIPFWINSYPDYYAFFHKADLYGLMILIIIAAALLPLHRMLQTWPLFFAASFTLLLLALSYGVYTRGTITSLSVGELFYVNVPATMSLLFIIGWAGLLAKFQSANKKQLIFCVFLAWITTMSFMILPNLKFAVIFLLISAIGIAFTQNKFRYRLTALIVTLAPFILLILLFSQSGAHAFSRFSGVFSLSGDTYHKEHIAAVLSQVEWFGTNVNITVNSDTFYLLPFDYTFLFIMHYGGIVFAILTCIFLLLLAWKFIWNTKAINHQPSKLLSYGVSILLIYPVLWNLFASLGLVNAVFLPMPFLTPASTMQLYYATLFGILVSLHRRRFTIFYEKKSKKASENESIR